MAKRRPMKGTGRLFRLWLVTCSGCESGHDTRWMEVTKRQAEALLRKEGWVYQDGVWRCQKHSRV